MSKIVVASTTAAWKCDGREELTWLRNAEAMRKHAADVGHEVEFFLAIETDARGVAPFDAIVDRICDLDGHVWRYSLDDGSDEILSGNRLIRICMGRNLAQEHAMRNQASHLLFLDTDVLADEDCIPKLLELQHPVVGGNVGAYCMDGPVVPPLDTVYSEVPHRNFPDGIEVKAHWNTAGFLMVERQVFSRVAWHYDLDAGLTDDPAYQRETRELFGETWVRYDVIGRHVGALVAVEERTDADRHIYR